MKTELYELEFIGTQPLMFDKYLGNESKAEWYEKLYLTEEGNVCIPAMNIYGLLCSENTKHALVKIMYAKKAPPIIQSLSVNVRIVEQYIPITGENNKILTTDDIAYKLEEGKQINKHYAVARIKKNSTTIVPNPKERPVIALPWSIKFHMEFTPDSNCKSSMLEEILRFGGSRCGLGTFRPFFGTFDVIIKPISTN